MEHVTLEKTRLGTTGPGTSMTVRGNTYTLTRSTKNIQSKWSEWLTNRAEERAFKTAERYRNQAIEYYDKAQKIADKYKDVEPSAITAEENEEATRERDSWMRRGRIAENEARLVIREFNDRVAGGEFEYYGNVAIDVGQQNLPGQIYLIWLCLLPKHPKITLDEVTALHLPGEDDGVNYIQDWREALLKSEGVKKKKEPSMSPSSIEPTLTKKDEADTETETKSFGI